MLRLTDVKRSAMIAGLFGSLALASGCESAGPPPTPQQIEQNQQKEADARRAAYGKAGIPTGKGMPKPDAGKGAPKPDAGKDTPKS